MLLSPEDQLARLQLSPEKQLAQLLSSGDELAQVQRTNLGAFVATYAFPILAPEEELRSDPYVFAMCYALEQIGRGEWLRLLLALPPRYLKSIAAVSLTAWMIGRDPTAKIIVVSYGGDLAAKQMRDFRKLINNRTYEQLFPALKIVRNTADEVETTAGGYRRSSTPNGATTGFGTDLVIIDDILKAGEADSEVARESANKFFDTTLYSRFNDKATGAILAIGQRLHEHDIIGHLQTKDEWHELILPAIAEVPESLPTYGGKRFERAPGETLSSNEPRERLDGIRRMIGDAAFSAQYQQNPIPPGGNRIKLEWFPTYDEAPPRERLLHVVQSLDTALKNDPACDYSVILTFGTLDGTSWLLLDLERRRLDYPDLRALAHQQYRKWNPDQVIIEQASTGGPLAIELRRMLGGAHQSRIIGRQPRLEKETRVEISTGSLKEGLIVLPTQAPWLAEFRREIAGFPAAAHDDQVDALTQFVEWLSSRRGRAFMETDPVTGRRLSGTRPHGSFYGRRRP